MKLFRWFIPSLAVLFIYMTASSQNVLINILTQKSGLVKKGKTVFLEVTVNNTDPVSFVNIYRVKTQISVPSAIASIDTAGHVLPTGWIITSNTGSTITLSNGKDMIAANDSRTLLIAVRGKTIGGPSTISGQLSFSNGFPPGTLPGVLSGDNPADNFSTSSCTVTR